MVIKTDMVTIRIMTTATLIPMRKRNMIIPTTPMAMIMARPTSPTPDMTIRTESMIIPMVNMTTRTTIRVTRITTMDMATLMGRSRKSSA